MEITAHGLLLRPWEPEDADAVFRACQDPVIQRWTKVPSPYQHEHARHFVTDLARAEWEAGTAVPLGVFDPDTGELLGSHGFVALGPGGRTGEIGYWTAPWARGKGVAERATRTVATWAFEVRGMARITWSAEVGNHASRLVAERVGFRVEGLRRSALSHHGELVDAWVGTLLPGQVTAAPPAWVAPGAPGSLRAKLFCGPHPTLDAGAGLRLRPQRLADLDAILAACPDPESVRWTVVPDPYRPADAEAFVAHCAAMWLRGLGAEFALADADDAYCGSMSLRISDADPAVANVGFLVAPWARGNGYATAALRALCEWGFESLGLERIEWRAYVGNEASRRVARNAGFVEEGVQRAALVQRGERRDAWVGAILRTDRAAR